MFDRLDTRSAKSPDTLAAELADPTMLYRLLRAQAAIGLLRGRLARIVLTDKGDLLRSDHPNL